MIDESKLYSVQYPKFELPFTYIIKHIGAEVHGHGQETP